MIFFLLSKIYVLITSGIAFDYFKIAFANSIRMSAVPQEAQTITTAPIEARAAAYPNRIEITVKISAHEDLKIAQDMTIAKGQIISDRVSGNPNF